MFLSKIKAKRLFIFLQSHKLFLLKKKLLNLIDFRHNNKKILFYNKTKTKDVLLSIKPKWKRNEGGIPKVSKIKGKIL